MGRPKYKKVVERTVDIIYCPILGAQVVWYEQVIYKKY